MGQPSPSRRRVPQACDRCRYFQSQNCNFWKELNFYRVKKGKCDGKKPVCTRCALDGQMCMFSERKFSKDRVIPKGTFLIYSLLLIQQIRRIARKPSGYFRNRSTR